MRQVERVVVYSGLALAIALGAGWRLGGSAWAGEAGEAGGAGGAGGVGGVGGVRVEAESKVATVDVLALTERVFQTEKYKPARDAMEKELRDKLQLTSDALLGMETRIKGMQQGSPEFQAAVNDYNQKYQVGQQEQQKANQQMVGFRNKQIIDAYREVQAAADRVAAKEGITHLFAARPASDVNFGQAEPVIEIISRPLLRTPAGTDLTDAVAKEMKLPAMEVKPVEIKPVDPNAPTAPPAAKPEVKPGGPVAPK